MSLLTTVPLKDAGKASGNVTAPVRPQTVATASPNERLKLFLASNHWLFLKWSLMACALVWLLIYRLSEAGEKLPDFVYVNF